MFAFLKNLKKITSRNPATDSHLREIWLRSAHALNDSHFTTVATDAKGAMVATATTKLTVHADQAIQMNWNVTRIADALRRVASESEAHQAALAEMIERVSEIAGRDPLRTYPVTLCFDVGAYPRADEAGPFAGESKSQPSLPTVRF